MGRIYRVTFDNVSCGAAQDLIFIPGASSTKMIRIWHRWVGASDASLPAAQMLQLRERFLPATVVIGSGGTTGITPTKTDPGDATCGISTAATNNTTKATTSGTPLVWWADGVHVYNGYDDTLDSPYPIGLGEAYVFELESAPSPAIHLSGGVEFEEIGG